jgi:anti-sigma factor RsiW
MSDESGPRVSESDHDALWALLDGELPAAAERALRERLTREPGLARALAEATEARAELRGLRDQPLEPAVRERMRAGLAARIASDTDPPMAEVRSIERYLTLRRVAGPLAAALAAGLAIGLLNSGIFDSASDSGEAPESVPIADAGSGETPSDGPQIDEDELFNEASEAEIAIALSYEVLNDYDVIAQLDLLEVLAAMEAAERI